MTSSEQDLLLALAVSPNFPDDQLAFAGRRSGLYRSRDGGTSWEACSLIPGESFSVTSLAFSPDFPHDQTLFAAVPGAVACSHDAGNAWFWTRLPGPSSYVSALAVSAAFAWIPALFAATLEDGVLRSIDGGVSWQSWNFGLLDKQVLCLAISSDGAREGRIYAGTGTGLFYSPNLGRSWREVKLPVEDAVLSLAMSGQHILVGTEGHGLLASNDTGESWQQIQSPGLEGPINAIHVSPAADATMHVLAGKNLMESRDGAETWQTIEIAAMDEPILLAASLVGFAAGQVMCY